MCSKVRRIIMKCLRLGGTSKIIQFHPLAVSKVAKHYIRHWVRLPVAPSNLTWSTSRQIPWVPPLITGLQLDIEPLTTALWLWPSHLYS